MEKKNELHPTWEQLRGGGGGGMGQEGESNRL